MISGYNAEPYAVKNLMQIVSKELRVSGFIVGSLYHKVRSPPLDLGVCVPSLTPTSPHLAPRSRTHLPPFPLPPARPPSAPAVPRAILQRVPRRGRLRRAQVLRGPHARARGRRRGDRRRAEGHQHGEEGHHRRGRMMPFSVAWRVSRGRSVARGVLCRITLDIMDVNETRTRLSVRRVSEDPCP